MTCIVGWAHDGVVTIGGDSAGVAGYLSMQRADEKIFVNGECIFGFTGSFRMGQLLRYKFKVPPRCEGMSDEEYLYGVFIDEVIRVLKDNGYAKVIDNEYGGGTFLLGYRGRLFRVEGDYQIGISAHPYDAVGCGAELALGALHALNSAEDGLPVEQCSLVDVKIKRALMASAEFSCWVRPPFLIMDGGWRGES